MNANEVIEDGYIMFGRYRARTLSDLIRMVRQDNPEITADQVKNEAVVMKYGEHEPYVDKSKAVSVNVVYGVMRAMFRFAQAHRGRARVEPVEADRRAAICANCPLNHNIHCFACMGMHIMGPMFFGAYRTPDNDRLHVCAVCRCLNRYNVLASDEVHREIAKYTGIGAEDFPDWCWKKKVLQ